ncbi:hypothetical protein GCM10009831_26440 [Dietzia cercidiphylli]|uniref:Uncharacterized protein n=1 Tax=Dietzia cercidiphylli TaxID=498199 RepID=A0ABP4V0A8_9ACTN
MPQTYIPATGPADTSRTCPLAVSYNFRGAPSPGTAGTAGGGHECMRASLDTGRVQKSGQGNG